jgi:hypothetical protein
MTVYLWNGHMTGIALHGIGSSDFVFGSRCGLPIHFALNQGEYLTSAWLSESKLGFDVERYLAVNQHPSPSLAGPSGFEWAN